MQTIEVFDLEITEFSFIYGGFDTFTKKYNIFIISIYRDDRILLKNHIDNLIKEHSYQCGFNNLDYDYPLLHFLILLSNKKNYLNLSVYEILEKLNDKNRQLIPDDKIKKNNKYGSKNYNVIYKPLIPQIDIFKINHWDNPNRKCSLKKAEINMRFNNVEEFDWYDINEVNYTEELENKLITYNINDINATKELYYLTRGQLDEITVDFPGMKDLYSEDRILFRIQMSKKYNVNMMNYSDVKIGEEINKITYLSLTKKSWNDIKNYRTFREYIDIKELIPNYIRTEFKDKQLIELLNVLDNTTINVNTEQKEENSKNKSFEYKFLYHGNLIFVKLGGIHSKDIAGKTIVSDNERFEEHDVSSMYPTAIIANKRFPQHLGKEWLIGYTNIRDERIKLKPLSKTDKHIKMIVDTYKLSLNGGGYGKTNDKNNYQYDPIVQYATTIKCQLDILLYTQYLFDKIPYLKIESYNTDGINIIYDTKYYNDVLKVKEKWEDVIKGELEITGYNKVIRLSVNDYIALKTNGKTKLKGQFEIAKEIHKDASSHIVNIALYEYFINNIPIEKTIKENDNIYNFLNTIRIQNTKQGRWELYHTFIENGEKRKIKMQRINRYYVCKNANHTIIKELNDGESFSFIEAGYNVKELNKVIDTNAKNYDINYNYYLKKARDIIQKIEDKQQKLF